MRKNLKIKINICDENKSPREELYSLLKELLEEAEYRGQQKEQISGGNSFQARENLRLINDNYELAKEKYIAALNKLLDNK